MQLFEHGHTSFGAVLDHAKAIVAEIDKVACEDVAFEGETADFQQITSPKTKVNPQ